MSNHESELSDKCCFRCDQPIGGVTNYDFLVNSILFENLARPEGGRVKRRESVLEITVCEPCSELLCKRFIEQPFAVQIEHSRAGATPSS